MKIHDLKNKFDKYAQERFELYSTWFLGEIAFTLLPIGIILAINLAFGESLNNLLLLSDWSFGAIVLFGVAIGQLIEIKTKYQKDFSYKVFAGTRLLMLFVIASSIVLALVILSQKNININPTFLASAQMFLFVVSAISVLTAVETKQEFLSSPRKSVKQIRSSLLRDYFRYALEEAEQNLHECHRILQVNSGKIFDADTVDKMVDINKDRERILLLIQNIEKQVAQVKGELQNTLASSHEIQSG